MLRILCFLVTLLYFFLKVYALIAQVLRLLNSPVYLFLRKRDLLLSESAKVRIFCQTCNFGTAVSLYLGCWWSQSAFLSGFWCCSSKEDFPPGASPGLLFFQ